MRPTKGRMIVYGIFGVTVVAVLTVMDHEAYGRAMRFYDRVERVARAGRSEPGFRVGRDGAAVTVAASGIPADLCNAFTGGLWFGFLMPRLSSVRHLDPDVRSRTGYCDRARTNTLLFRFERAGADEGHHGGAAGDGRDSTAGSLSEKSPGA